MLVEEELVRVQRRDLPGEELAERAVEGQMLVGIAMYSTVGSRKAIRAALPGEGNTAKGTYSSAPLARSAPHRPRSPRVPARPFEVHIPVCVVKIIVVEVDGPIFVPGVAPAHLFARKIPTGHAARRQVDDLAVEVMRRAIGNFDGRDVARKIPGAEDVRRDGGGDRLIPHALDLQPVQCAADQPGASRSFRCRGRPPAHAPFCRRLKMPAMTMGALVLAAAGPNVRFAVPPSFARA